jgi:hypothetical protein
VEAQPVEAVGALRARRDRVREAMQAPPPTEALPPLPPAATPTRPLPLEPGVFTPPVRTMPPAEQAAAEKGGLTDRLRRAKARAQDDIRKSAEDR